MTTARTDNRLALATDAAAVGPAIGASLGAALPDARWSTLKVANVLPAAGGGHALQYVVETGTTPAPIGALLGVPAGDRPAWTSVPGTAWIPELGLATALPQSDPKLAGIARVLAPGWAEELAVALGWAAVPGAPEIMAYRLGKRCVLKISAGGNAAVVKIVRPSRLSALAARLAAVAATPEVPVPAVLHVDEKAGALALAWVPGRGIENLRGGDAANAHAAAGRLLRAFHAPVADAAPGWTASRELEQLADWAGRTGDLLPAATTRLAALVTRLQAAVPGEAPPVRLHRDFYDKQVLVDGVRATLLDLDTMTSGDPALDVGNHLAHVILRSRQEPGRSPAADVLAGEFLGGYGADAELQSRALWWQAAALARLVVIYTLRPRWRDIIPLILEDAETCLGTWEESA
jgi:hypothetical protein